MADLIERSAAICALEKCHKKCCREDTVGDEWIHYETTLNEIESLPSAQPKRKTGRWIPMEVSSGRDSWKCSVCGRRARGKLENLPYCHCGAKMDGKDEALHKSGSLLEAYMQMMDGKDGNE